MLGTLLVPGRARFWVECQTRSPSEGAHTRGRRMLSGSALSDAATYRWWRCACVLTVRLPVCEVHLAEATVVRRLVASSLISATPADQPPLTTSLAFALPTTALLVVLLSVTPKPRLNEPCLAYYGAVF